MTVDGRPRNYLVHIPPNHQPQTPTPVALVFHGAGTTAAMTVEFSGLNKKSDAAGFVAVYPSGTGLFPTFNAGGRKGILAQDNTDDVMFVAALIG